MVVFQLGDDLFHYGFAKKSRLGADLELVAICLDGSEFPVIEIKNRAVLAHQRSLLLLQKIRVNLLVFAFCSHTERKIFVQN